MRVKKLRRLSLARQNVLAGYVFATPFILGFLFVFLLPLVQSLTFSLSQVNVTRSGYELKYIGLENFRYILRGHPPLCVNSLRPWSTWLRTCSGSSCSVSLQP